MRDLSRLRRRDRPSVLGGREALGRGVGEPEQLRRELPGVLDDLLALGPDPVGLGIEVLEALLGLRR